MAVGSGNGLASGLRLSKAVVSRTADDRHGDLADQAKSEGDFHSAGVVDSHIQNDNFALSQQEKIFIQRVKRGVQDICVDCKGEISPARRKAVETAIRCRDCQEKL